MQVSHVRQGNGRRERTLTTLGGCALALVLGLLVAVSPMLGIGMLVGLAAAAGFARSGTFAICAFAAATYFEVVTRYTGPMLSPVKLGGGALVAVALATLLVRRRPRPGLAGDVDLRVGWAGHPVVVGTLLAFVTLAVASAAWAVDLAQVRTLGIRLVSDALVLLAVGVFLQRAAQLRALAWTVLVAAGAAWAFGLVTGATLAGRAIGTFSDPNEFASALVPALALGYAAVTTASSWPARAVGLALVAAAAVGVVQSQSRGGLIAVVVVAIVLATTARGRERVRLAGALLVAVCSLVLVVALTPPDQGLRARLASNDSSGRTDLWRVAMHEWRDHPALGVGLGNYPAVSLRYLDADVRRTDLFVGAPRTTHNTVLEILAELGAVGLALYLTFVAGCVATLVRTLRHTRRALAAGEAASGSPADLVLGRAVLAALLGAMATGIFLSAQYQELQWVLLGACLAFAPAATRSSSASSRSTVAARPKRSTP